jgi:hypothetical protein
MVQQVVETYVALQWTMISIQIVCLALFAYYLRRYRKVITKAEKDLFCSGFFLMVIISLLSRILIRGFSLISI